MVLFHVKGLLLTLQMAKSHTLKFGMKTPSAQLFHLIKKMSAAEKRFLKIHFSSVKSHLTELFDFVNAQDIYDEKVVKAHFSDSLISKNLKVYKVQLTELILRSQVAYHAKRTVRSQIRILLEEVDILISQFLVLSLIHI